MRSLNINKTVYEYIVVSAEVSHRFIPPNSTAELLANVMSPSTPRLPPVLCMAPAQAMDIAAVYEGIIAVAKNSPSSICIDVENYCALGTG